MGTGQPPVDPQGPRPDPSPEPRKDAAVPPTPPPPPPGAPKPPPPQAGATDPKKPAEQGQQPKPGEKIDPEPLQKIADMLSIPVENLYRLAGYLPAEEAQTQVLREIESLLRQLPEADQRRILEVVRVEHKFREHREQNEGQDRRSDTGSRQKAG